MGVESLGNSPASTIGASATMTTEAPQSRGLSFVPDTTPSFHTEPSPTPSFMQMPEVKIQPKTFSSDTHKHEYIFKLPEISLMSETPVAHKPAPKYTHIKTVDVSSSRKNFLHLPQYNVSQTLPSDRSLNHNLSATKLISGDDFPAKKEISAPVDEIKEVATEFSEAITEHPLHLDLASTPQQVFEEFDSENINPVESLIVGESLPLQENPVFDSIGVDLPLDTAIDTVPMPVLEETIGQITEQLMLELDNNVVKNIELVQQLAEAIEEKAQHKEQRVHDPERQHEYREKSEEAVQIQETATQALSVAEQATSPMVEIQEVINPVLDPQVHDEVVAAEVIAKFEQINSPQIEEMPEEVEQKSEYLQIARAIHTLIEIVPHEAVETQVAVEAAATMLKQAIDTVDALIVAGIEPQKAKELVAESIVYKRKVKEGLQNAEMPVIKLVKTKAEIEIEDLPEHEQIVFAQEISELNEDEKQSIEVAETVFQEDIGTQNNRWNALLGAFENAYMKQETKMQEKKEAWEKQGAKVPDMPIEVNGRDLVEELPEWRNTLYQPEPFKSDVLKGNVLKLDGSLLLLVEKIKYLYRLSLPDFVNKVTQLMERHPAIELKKREEMNAREVSDEQVEEVYEGDEAVLKNYIAA